MGASQVKNKNSFILDLNQCPTNINKCQDLNIESHLLFYLKAKKEI